MKLKNGLDVGEVYHDEGYLENYIPVEIKEDGQQPYFGLWTLEGKVDFFNYPENNERLSNLGYDLDLTTGEIKQ